MRERDVYLSSTSMTLRLCEWGPVSGRPLLFLHGFLDQAFAWSPVLSPLNRRVIAPDHRGHGLSGHLPPKQFYYFWDYVADVDALLDTINGQVDLVGHSMGGTIASLYAALRPERVRSLVLLEGLGPPDSTPVALQRGLAFLNNRKKPPLHRNFSGVEEAASRMRRFSPNLSREWSEQLAARVLRKVSPGDAQVSEPDPSKYTWTWDPRHRQRNPRPFDPVLHRQYLQQIKVPTLLVEGRRTLFEIKDRKARADAIPDATTVWVDTAGHQLHHDAPAEITTLIAQACGS